MSNQQLSFTKDELIKRGSNTGFDARKLAKPLTYLGLAAIAAVGLHYVLPYLKDIVWNLVSVATGVGILCLMGFTFITFRKHISHFMDILSKRAWGWLIEMDEFRFQEKVIEQAEKDMEEMLKEAEIIEGKYVELNQNVIEYKKNFEIAKEAEKIARKKGEHDLADDQAYEMQRLWSYIESVEPIVVDLDKMVIFIKEIHKILERNIKNAKQDLRVNKDIFKSVTAGANALSRAERAALGDTDMNNMAEMARQRVREKIALSVGRMKSSMDVLQNMSKTQNLQDSAKLEVARKQLIEINGEEALKIGNFKFKQAQPMYLKNNTEVSKFGDYNQQGFL